MKRYKIEVYFTAYKTVIVEDKDEYEAIKKACADLSVLSCTDVEADINNSFVLAEEEMEEPCK